MAFFPTAAAAGVTRSKVRRALNQWSYCTVRYNQLTDLMTVKTKRQRCPRASISCIIGSDLPFSGCEPARVAATAASLQRQPPFTLYSA